MNQMNLYGICFDDNFEIVQFLFLSLSINLSKKKNHHHHLSSTKKNLLLLQNNSRLATDIFVIRNTILFQEFFKAAEDGSIERLDELFDTVANADPNMTNVRKENHIQFDCIN